MPQAAPARREGRAARRELRAALLGWLIAFVLRLIHFTLRVRHIDRAEMRARHARGEQLIVAFWHDAITLMPLMVTRLAWPGRITAMLSQHRDAEIAGRALNRLGIGTVRGSSTRGGIGALRGLVTAHRRGDDVVIVPDGPRGPRHHAKEGPVQLARSARLPVIVFGVVAHPAGRLRSWDRLQIPWPFARVALVSEAVDPGAAEDPRLAVQQALDRLTAEAAAEVGAAR